MVDVHRADVVVVGSGAGGSVAARELARAGLDVTVLEEGPRLSRDVLAGGSPAENFRRLYRDGGLVPILGSPPIPYGEGRCVGGTTVVNGGLLWHPPASLLDRWADASGVDGYRLRHLERHLRAIDERLGAVEQAHGDGNRDSRLLARAADELGWEWKHSRRAVRGCLHANRCVTGCPTGAKQSMAETYLPDAEAAGAEIVANTRVRDLASVPGGWRVRVGGRRSAEYRARTVFVAAGPWNTPALLQRSGIAGRTAGARASFHVNLRTVARFDEPVHARRGTIFTAQLQEFTDRGVLVMPANLSTGNLGAALASHPPSVVNSLVGDVDRVATYTTQVRLASTARVRTLPGGRPVVRHSLDAADRATLRDALHHTVDLLLRAGATELYPCIPGTGPWTGAAQARAELDASDARTWDMVSVHAMASCRMGRVERGGVCDDAGRPHGVDGLVVCDASVLPGPTGISPQQTVMAFAHEITERFLERAGPRSSPRRAATVVQ